MDISDDEWLYDETDDFVMEQSTAELPAQPRPQFASYDPNDPFNWYLRVEPLSAGQPKKRRLLEDEEWLDDTVERVLSAREALNTSAVKEVALSRNGGKSEPCPTERIFLVPPEGDDWLPLTLPDYSRVYLALERSTACDAVSKSHHVAADRHLLDMPFQQLLRAAETMNVSQLPPVATNEEVTTIQSNQTSPSPIINDSQLWSSKYRPCVYIDLLSDEGANRTLLTWLKLWDQCVFKKLKKAPKDLTAFVKRTVITKMDKAPPKKGDGFGKQLDDSGRPVPKIALLAGPPGVGKTTLAHMVARICGYHVLEMNASDDRSIDAFEHVLKGALQMKRTLDVNPKPICLVIDEIDGAPTPSVNHLVSLVNGTAGIKRRQRLSLNRPIICICNDLYSPCLRELRKVSLVLSVPALETRRLSERLLQICTSEALQTELAVLDVLCRKAKNDIRCCINALQFLQSTRRTITLDDVQRFLAAGKDSKKSLFEIWHLVFTGCRRRSNRIGETATAKQCPSDNRVADILHAAASCDHEDVLLEGLFENYPLVPFKDNCMENVCAGLRWVIFADMLARHVAHNQQYEMFAYRRYVAVAFNLLFAINGQYAKLQYPSAGAEAIRRRSRNEQLLHSFFDELPCAVRRTSIDRIDFTIDVLPFLLNIVQPQLRSAHVQLFRQYEMVAFEKTVRLMSTFNLTYRQQRVGDGDVQTLMEPYQHCCQLARCRKCYLFRPIDSVVIFPLHCRSYSSSSSSRLADDVRLTVAREIQRTKLGGSITGGDCPNRNEAKGNMIVGFKKSNASFVVEFKYQPGSDNEVKRRVGLKQFA